MKKVLLLLLLISTLSVCKYFSQLDSDKDLTKIIEAKIKSNPAEIDLSNLDNLDYDKLLILEPYTIINKVEQKLNIDLSNISENNIHLSDDINLLVFIKDNQSVKTVELPRINGDFECYNILIDRKNAIFEKIGSSNMRLKK